MADYKELFNKFLGLSSNNEDSSNETKEEVNNEENIDEQSNGENVTQESNEEYADTDSVNDDNTDNNDTNDNNEKFTIIVDGQEVGVDENTFRELANSGYEYQNLKNQNPQLFKEAKELINNNVNPELLQAFRKAVDGDVGAVKHLINTLDISLDEIVETDDNFEMEQSGIAPEVEEYIEKVSKKNPEIIQKLNSTISELDDVSIADITNDNKKHIAFINAVANGEFEKYLPKAKIIKMKNPALSLLEAWAYVYNEDNNTQEKDENKKPQNTDFGTTNTEESESNLSYEDYFKKFIQD